VGSASHLPLQNDQLMSKYRILNLKPAVRLEWRGQNGQNEADQCYHCANLADSVTWWTRIWFSVHTAFAEIEVFFRRCVVAGQRDGTIALQPADDLARLFLGIVLGIRVLARAKPERALLEGLARPALASLQPAGRKAARH
jgi:hypothetical protein